MVLRSMRNAWCCKLLMCVAWRSRPGSRPDFQRKVAVARRARRIRRATDPPRPEKTSDLRVLPRST